MTFPLHWRKKENLFPYSRSGTNKVDKIKFWWYLRYNSIVTTLRSFSADFYLILTSRSFKIIGKIMKNSGLLLKPYFVIERGIPAVVISNLVCMSLIMTEELTVRTFKKISLVIQIRLDVTSHRDTSFNHEVRLGKEAGKIAFMKSINSCRFVSRRSAAWTVHMQKQRQNKSLVPSQPLRITSQHRTYSYGQLNLRLEAWTYHWFWLKNLADPNGSWEKLWRHVFRHTSQSRTRIWNFSFRRSRKLYLE